MTQGTRRSHIGKRMCLSIAATIAAHMLSTKAYNKLFPAPAASAYPNATASLARIPIALVAGTAIDLIDRCYLRQTEYEADAVLKKSPYLAQKQLQYLSRTQLLQEQKFEKETRDTWENVRGGKPSKTGIFSWLLAKNMSQSSYLAFQWRMYNFLNSHPCVADRAKNLGL
jgi:Zn-dependent protease with chaperone function